MWSRPSWTKILATPLVDGMKQDVDSKDTVIHIDTILYETIQWYRTYSLIWHDPSLRWPVHRVHRSCVNIEYSPERRSESCLCGEFHNPSNDRAVVKIISFNKACKHPAFDRNISCQKSRNMFSGPPFNITNIIIIIIIKLYNHWVVCPQLTTLFVLMCSSNLYLLLYLFVLWLRQL